MSTLFSHFFQKINQIPPLEANFTEVLESIAVKPKMLYFRGKMPENVLKNGILERPKTVAIVGSRHNTRYGEEVAYDLAYKLAKKGVIIISGLAFGIDSIGHRACLDAGGRTVAVLGTSIDKIYPRSHTALAREIVEKDGLILSEYAPGAQILPKISFLERNRLISALSDIVVVVEAAERSGSLNTATHALNQGKEVFAVPGNINNPYSRGCNRLIAAGANPYLEPDDVLRILFPEDYLKKRKTLKSRNLVGDNDIETLILTSLSEGLRSGEAIMEKNLLPPELFNQTITLLEIKGRVRALGANNWSLI
ncbi:MAG: DNA-processing protein DprA [Candidatus Saccharibacteria bacterium]|nr:DNA-processing protein DprA [Candidatus Saccharibacteria bacterium]